MSAALQHRPADMGLSARRVQEGESFSSIAAEIFGDPRLGGLLEDVNPEVRGGRLHQGQALRIPSREYARSWASQLGLQLGFDPARSMATKARRRWDAFAAPGGGLRLAGDAVVKLASSTDFARLVDRVAVLDTTGRGAAVWDAVERLGSAEVRKSLGRTPAAKVQAGIEATSCRRAVDEAVDVHVRATLARRTGRVLELTADALHHTGSRKLRICRLLVALRAVEPERATQLLLALGLDRGQAAETVSLLETLSRARRALGRFHGDVDAHITVENMARASGVDLEEASVAKWLSSSETSAAARDRLATRLAGLDQTVRALQLSLPALEKAVRKVASGLAVQDGRPPQPEILVGVARALGYPIDSSRNELGAERSDSPVALALDRLLGTTPRPLSPLARTALRLPSLLGAHLMRVDAATIERGLGAVLGTLRKQDASPADLPALMSAADLRAREAVAAAKASGRQLDVSALGALAAQLIGSDLTRREGARRGHKAVDARQRLAAQLRRHCTSPATTCKLPRARDLQDEIDELLEQAGTARAQLPDAEVRAQRVRRHLDARPEWVDQLIRALPRAMPPAGDRRINTRGAALVLTAALLDRAHRLRREEITGAQLAAILIEQGGMVLERCERELVRSFDADSHGAR